MGVRELVLPGMVPARARLASEIRQLVGGDAAGVPEWRATDSDPGLFGPGSAAWAVHSDVATMMIGGTAALLLQMLHPGALAGVWDHSNFRADSYGRLRRTAQFIAGTTYGTRTHATATIAKIRRIHDHVHGRLPDGRAYSANDPALLTWVHVVGAHSFLAAYRRYRDPGFAPARQDDYYRETAAVAYGLGATAVPETRSDVDRYLRAMQPELRFDARTRDVTRALLDQPPPHAAAAPASRLMQQAGIDLLPAWGAELHGLRVAGLRQPLVRAGANGLGKVLRWALAS